MIFNPVSSIKLMRQYMWTVQQDNWISHVDFDFDFWFFCFTFILNLPKWPVAKYFFFKFDQKLSFPLTMQIQFQPCWSQKHQEEGVLPCLSRKHLFAKMDWKIATNASLNNFYFVIIRRMQSIINIKDKNSVDQL